VRAATGRTRHLTELVVPSLDAVVEGAWVSLVYVAIQLGPVHGDAVLGPAAFVVAAAVGVAWARWVQRADRHVRWGWTIWAIALAAGIGGWLCDPATRAAVMPAGGGFGGFAGLEVAAATNVGGWLLGLAILRGATHATRARDDERVRAMLDRILLLAIPWALGIAFAGEARPTFVAAALVSTLLFVGSALLAVGLGRLESLGASAGVDWRRNRAWVVIVVGVIVAILALSVPAALLVGAPPRVLLDVVWVPIAVTVGLVTLLAGVVAAPVLWGFESVLSALPTPVATPIPSPSGSALPGGGIMGPTAGDPRVGLTIAILVLVAIAVVVVALAGRPRIRATGGTRAAGGPPAPEERAIVLPRIRPRAPSLHLRTRRRRIPTTAPEAYLAVLDALASDPVLARRPGESPRAHGRRLRALRIFAPEAPLPGSAVDAAATRPTAGGATRPVGAGTGGRDRDADLALLVADGELARYAARTITPAEDRRGIARWRRITTAVGHRGRRRS